MSAGTTRDRVRTVIATTLGFHVDRVEGATTFEAMQADSLDVIEVVIALEDRFAVKIDDDEGAALKSVDDAIHLVERKLAEAGDA